ncbi:MAG: hypothetical protein KN64_08960 [Sulfurovum sp. AS07-7]|nr:MAG: hypothetical protein KN64_08960 [Sulfurovum sp. AS07-7]
MKVYLSLLMVFLLFMGCSDDKSASSDDAYRKEVVTSEPVIAEANVTTEEASGDISSSATPTSALALQHSISLEIEASKVQPLFHQIEEMCQKIAITQHCQLINSNLSKEQEPSANLSLKAKAQGIKMIIEVLNKNNVTNYAVNSENLAGSISDVQKRVAMLTSYRDNLEKLSKKTNSSLESLMKVNQEMATVQSEIETLRGEHAFMVDRVQTQTLNISISTKYLSTTEDTFITVLKDAIIGSIDDAINGLKLILVAFIYLLPWAFLGFVVYFIYRKIKLKA